MILTLGTNGSSRTVLRWQNAPNGHVFVTGRSGTGKSFFLRQLVYQLHRQGVRCIILDASQDWAGQLPDAPGLSPSVREAALFIDVRSDAFTLDPLLPQQLRAGVEEDHAGIAHRFSDTLRGAFRLPQVQSLYLSNATCDYLDRCPGTPSIPGLLTFLSGGLEPAARKRIELSIERLRSFNRSVHCGSASYDWQLDTPGLTVVDFSRVPSEPEQALVTELILGDLWGQRMRQGAELVPAVVVMDECQRLKFGPRNFTTRLLREGRKYRLSGWFASQWLSDKEAVAALDQAALRAYFQPETSNVGALAKRLSVGNPKLTQTYARHLGQLRVGQFLYHNLNGRPIIANVQAMPCES